MKEVKLKMWKDFKKFALKGNVVDLAVGVIIGGAFGKIVTSLVNDIIMPIVGKLIGNVDFSNIYINLTDKDYASFAEAQKAGAATINIGLFLNNVLDFLIIAFSIFMVIRQLNRFKKQEAAKVTTKTCKYCCTDIPLEASRCPHCTSVLEEK